MQPIRIIYEDTPDSIPVPKEPRRGKTKIILWPLDGPPLAESVTATKDGRARPGAWAHLNELAADWDRPLSARR